MTSFCPACWHDLPSPSAICPRCGTEPGRFSDETSFEQKLLLAVFHPEPATARRAIWILGEKRCQDAVPSLDRAAQQNDLYMILAIVDALEKIATEPAQDLLRRLLHHESGIVAREVLGALSRLKQNQESAVSGS